MDPASASISRVIGPIQMDEYTKKEPYLADDKKEEEIEDSPEEDEEEEDEEEEIPASE